MLKNPPAKKPMIPTELCFYTLRNKLYRPFQLYMALKYLSNGKIRLTKEDLIKLKALLGLKSEKTIQNNLKKLISIGWIGHDEKSGIYFVRSYEILAKRCGVKFTVCAEFDFTKLKFLKYFVAGAAISLLVNRQIRKKRLKEAKVSGVSKRLNRSSFLYMPVANLALAKIFKCSISTAFELKKLAVKGKYIEVKKDFKPTKFSPQFRKEVAKANPEIANRLKVIMNNLMIQDSDLVTSLVWFKTKRKKSKHIVVVR